ncbi:MAG TPA: hypothetical protein PLZ42_01075 [Methanothrix sp.]|nr:hypothetical protein [Methanothrix sp.]
MTDMMPEDIASNDELEKRDQLIYDSVIRRFDAEWERKINLDGKMTGLISFIGVILTLDAGLGGFLLKEVEETNGFRMYLCLIFVLSIVFLMGSMIQGLRSYAMTEKWAIVPDPDYLIEEYAMKNRDRTDILRNTAIETKDATIYNKVQNDEKSRLISSSCLLLACGVIVSIIFIFILIYSEMVIGPSDTTYFEMALNNSSHL